MARGVGERQVRHRQRARVGEQTAVLAAAIQRRPIATNFEPCLRRQVDRIRIRGQRDRPRRRIERDHRGRERHPVGEVGADHCGVEFGFGGDGQRRRLLDHAAAGAVALDRERDRRIGRGEVQRGGGGARDEAERAAGQRGVRAGDERHAGEIEESHWREPGDAVGRHHGAVELQDLLPVHRGVEADRAPPAAPGAPSSSIVAMLPVAAMVMPPVKLLAAPSTTVPVATFSVPAPGWW